MATYIGSNVFVTGASRGIGLGLVKHLINYPDVKHIFAGARTPSQATDLQDLAKESPKVKIVQFDSLSDESIKNAVREVEKAVGSDGLNLLINNAGVFFSVCAVNKFVVINVFRMEITVKILTGKLF
jgi:NAD(P)-dependent dehydrogenase (short-subunit alcohol dehydrogenase family)